MTDRPCKECGSTDWNKFHEEESGERGNKYTKAFYECQECGAHGREFDHPGDTIWSGALRS